MRKKEMLKIGAIAALFFLVGVAPGWSICGPVDDWVNKTASSDVYYTKTGGMFLRGVHRIIESPVEIGYYTYDGAKNHLGYGEGILKGLGTGTLWAADDIIRGAWDIMTALFPNYHGEPGTHDLGKVMHGG